MYIVISKLEGLLTRGTAERGQTDRSYGSVSPDDLRECQYLLQTLSRVLSCLSHNGWVTLVSHPVSPVEKPRDASNADGKSLSDVIVVLRLISFARNRGAEDLSNGGRRHCACGA